MSDPVKLKTDLTIVKEDDLAKFDSTMLGRSGTEKNGKGQYYMHTCVGTRMHNETTKAILKAAR